MGEGTKGLKPSPLRWGTVAGHFSGGETSGLRFGRSETGWSALAITFVVGPGSEDSDGVHTITPLCMFNAGRPASVDTRSKGNANLPRVYTDLLWCTVESDFLLFRQSVMKDFSIDS